MTRDTITKVNWSRLGVIVGVLGGAILLLTAATSVLDWRYVKRGEFQVIDTKLERILDAVCDSTDTRRVCR